MKKYSRSFMLVVLGLLLVAGCAVQTKKGTEIPDDIVWPPPPDIPRIKLIGSYHSKEDVEKSTDMLRFLGEATDFRVLRPHGIVADRDGNIYVSDTGLNVFKVFVFDFTRKKFRMIGATGPAKVKIPLGLAVDNNSNLLFVADSGDNVVKVFDKDTGSLRFIIGQRQGTFQRPVSVAVDPARQRVYVADSKIHSIKVFDYQSKYLFMIGKGEASSEDDGFIVPSQIALDRNGNLYVADMFNRYIKVFDTEGTFVKKLGYGTGMGFGNFSKLTGVAVNSEGHVYALDTELCNFQIFDQENKLLLAVGSPGGHFSKLFMPSRIFIDEKDRIYVSDTMNRRVQVYEYLKHGDHE